LKEVKTTVSVLMCVRNVEKYIDDCIRSILNQTFTDFELVVIDDLSNDKTKNIIEKFKDKRIRYFRNGKWLGISKSRNLCVKHANGDYLFFTDGDCVVSRDWIEQGLKFLEDPNCVGVEGKIYYVSEEYKPTFSDHFLVSNCGDFRTGNVAYKRSVVVSVGGFDERYGCHEDRDLGLRILRVGKIKFNPNMIVFVQQQTLTPKELIKRSDAIRNRVYLFKKFRDRESMVWRIVDPVSLAKILFPPLIFTSLFFNRFRKLDDFKLVPFKYIYAVCARLQLWKESAKERVFLI
jgi:glycosyltransferase involved in cell wall biosynthesis